MFVTARFRNIKLPKRFQFHYIIINWNFPCHLLQVLQIFSFQVLPLFQVRYFCDECEAPTGRLQTLFMYIGSAQIANGKSLNLFWIKGNIFPHS
jgi:hypothetical protein